MVNRPKDKWYREMTYRELDDAYNLKLTECSIENNLTDEERDLCEIHINEYRNEILYRWEKENE